MAKWYGEQIDYREYPQHAHWMLAEADTEKRADEVMAWIKNVSRVE